MNILKKFGYIKEEKIPEPAREPSFKKPTFRDQSVKHELEEEADESVDIIESDDPYTFRPKVLDDEEYVKEKNEKSYIFSGTGEDIKRSDWMPKSVTEHDKEFVELIDSLLYKGFSKMNFYRPFAIYCQQAETWLGRNYSETDFDNQEEKDEYWDQEIIRCSENSLYFLDRHVMLKDGDMFTFNMKYDSKPVHKLICFLFDCGYSMEIGKPRQIAATSTLGALALKTVLFRKNVFMKYIAQDKLKAEEILEDKIKYPFGELPDDLKPSVSNDRDNLFKLGMTEVKGTKIGVNSKLQVVAPSVSAINGGSPNVVFIDEAGYIGILGKMIKEARPTLFGVDPKTGRIIQKRQIIIWGTGGEMDKGGKAYEEEYHATVRMWRERKFTHGIIPIFFDWTTRPGINQAHYDQEKEVYYAVQGPEAQTSKIQFHQAYPSSIEDMFLTSMKTLIPIDFIVDNLDRIRKFQSISKAQKGYFEPVYDTTRPQPEYSDIPYEIIGATFVPCENEGDTRATVTIFQHPKKWLNRYYQGTDPTASDNGLSKMASAIWDAHYCTVPAVVNYRDSNYKYTYMQCLLLGIYYNCDKEKKALPELLEANLGTAYREYKDNKGYGMTLVFNTELPHAFRQQLGTIIGIDNKGIRNKLIIDKMYEIFSAFGDKIYIDEAFIQLKTFVCTINKTGHESWGPIDKRHYNDDILFAIVFAYICSLCYAHRVPVEIDTISEKKTTTSYEVRYDKNWNQYRAPVKKQA